MRIVNKVLVLAIVTASLLAGGCQTVGNGNEMPVPEAWYQMKREVENGTWIDRASKWITGKPTDFAEEKTKKLEDARHQAEGQPLDAYDRLVDQAAQKLATDLPALSAVQNADRKQVLIVGDVVNEAGISDKELETALRELSGKLQENEQMRQRFVFVGMTTDAAKRALDAAGAGQPFEFTDPLSPIPGGAAVKYNPTSIYSLTGGGVLVVAAAVSEVQPNLDL